MNDTQKANNDFNFMLKEYEMLYGKFEMHYDAVEKTFRIYLLINGGFLSLIGFLSKKNSSFEINIWNLDGFVSVILFMGSITGLFIYFKIIEHRLLIIAYVKSLNLNRKWFADKGQDIKKYFYFPTGIEKPSFYKKYRHFYWEAVLLAFINSIFLALLIINLIIDLLQTPNENYLIINSVTMLLLLVVLMKLQLMYYQKRGEHEEREVKKRINS